MKNDDPVPDPISEKGLFQTRFGEKPCGPASVSDAMQRDEPQAWKQFWEFNVQDGLVYGPIATLVVFAITLAQHDYGFATLMPSLWFGWCLLLVPVLVWGVLMRQEPGDVSITLAALAIGAAPGVLFLPGLWGSEMPTVMVAFPILVAWGAAGHVLALNQHWLASSTVRPMVLIAAGLLCALASAALFAAVVAGGMGAFWRVVCALIALAMAFACFKLWLAAGQPRPG
ncbi:MAG: hypothetical protein ABI655_06030 [Phenylobacterium sp.]